MPGTPAEDVGAQLLEISEADAAAERALASLDAAHRKLDSARSWGTVDTWLGGGLFASLAKHDRINDAKDYLHDVDAALETLRRELADVRLDVSAIGGVGGLDIGSTLDIWFDNFFTDLAVQSRLADADRRLDQVGEALHALRRALHARRTELTHQLRASSGD